jgi:hypothetical protein
MSSKPTATGSLKDRIAALEQRNASAGSNSNSSTPSLPTSSALKDRIAKFESKGGVPVPRGSFGMGAPPLEEARLRTRGELYGNRIASVPGVHPGSRLVMSHTGSAVPPSSMPSSANNRRFSVSVDFSLPQFDPSMGPSPLASPRSPPAALTPSSPPPELESTAEDESTTIEDSQVVSSLARTTLPEAISVNPTSSPTFPITGSKEVASASPTMSEDTANGAASTSATTVPSPLSVTTGLSAQNTTAPTLDTGRDALSPEVPINESTSSRSSTPTATPTSIPQILVQQTQSPIAEHARDSPFCDVAERNPSNTQVKTSDTFDTVSSSADDISTSANNIQSTPSEGVLQVVEVPSRLSSASSLLPPTPTSAGSSRPVSMIEASMTTAERFAPQTGRAIPMFLPGPQRAKSDFFTPDDLLSAIPIDKSHSFPRSNSFDAQTKRAKASDSKTFSIVVHDKVKEGSQPVDSSNAQLTPQMRRVKGKPDTPTSPGFQDLAMLASETARLEELLAGGFPDHDLAPLAFPTQEESAPAFEGPTPAAHDIASLASRPIKKKRSLKTTLNRGKTSSQNTLKDIPPPVPSKALPLEPESNPVQRKPELDHVSELLPTPPPSKSKKYFSSLRRLGSHSTTKSSHPTRHSSVSTSSLEDSPQLATPSDDNSEFGMRPSRPSSTYGLPTGVSWPSLSPKRAKSNGGGGMLRATSLAEKWYRARTKSTNSSLDVPDDVSPEEGRQSIMLPALTLLPPLESVTPRSSSDLTSVEDSHTLCNPPARSSSLMATKEASPPRNVRPMSYLSDTSFSSSISPTPIDPEFFDSFPPVPQNMPQSKLGNTTILD